MRLHSRCVSFWYDADFVFSKDFLLQKCISPYSFSLRLFFSHAAIPAKNNSKLF